MKLDYGTLLSFEPFYLPYGFGIISPTLKEISKIHFNIYHHYLSILNIGVDEYYANINNEDINYFSNYSDDEKETILKIKAEYNDLSSMERDNIIPVGIFSYDKRLIDEISAALSFFTDKEFEYSQKHNSFIHMEDDKISATLDLRIYDEVVDLIFQRNGINKPKQEEKPKFKSKLAEKLYYRSLQAKTKYTKNNDTDKTLNIPNILSAVAAKHNSLNIMTIWDITIYQLYDQFKRLQNNSVYDIESLSVAAWGDKKNKFDRAMWYKNITL